MRDLLPRLLEWQEAGKSVALATVVSAWGSAPRPLGSKMIISSEGETAGSVSGGCVEGAVAEEAARVLGSGKPKLVSYGVADETAWGVGLSCGGRIEIFIEPVPALGSAEITNGQSALFRSLVERLESETVAARVILLSGESGEQALIDTDGTVVGSLGSRASDEQAAGLASEQIEKLASARRTLDMHAGTYDLFVDVYLPRPKLIVIGAVHVAIHLVALARRLGYRTTVIDPRIAQP